MRRCISTVDLSLSVCLRFSEESCGKSICDPVCEHLTLCFLGVRCAERGDCRSHNATKLFREQTINDGLPTLPRSSFICAQIWNHRYPCRVREHEVIP